MKRLLKYSVVFGGTAMAGLLMAGLMAGDVLAIDDGTELLTAAGAGDGDPAADTLPQLDIGTFPTQIFWLFVTFVVLYVAMTRIAIPRIEDVLEKRHGRIAEDLDKAGKLKADAEEVRANYENALAEARDSAQKLVGNARDEASRGNIAAEAAADAAAQQRVREAEAVIETARSEALSNVRDVVSEVAGDAVQKLIDVTVSRDELDRAVATAMEAK